MKKIFIVFVILPFFVFADLLPDQLYRYTPYTSNSSGGWTAQTLQRAVDASNLFYQYISSPNGLSYTVSSPGRITLKVPAEDTIYNTVTNKTKSINYSVQGQDDLCYYSTLRAIPQVSSCLLLLAKFREQGLVSSGYYSVYTNSSGQIFLTVNPIQVFADSLISTNTVFRSQCIDFLSSINTNIGNIDSNVAAILSLISSNSSSSPSLSASNLLSRAESLYSVGFSSGVYLDINKIIDMLDTSNKDLSTPEAQEIYNQTLKSVSDGLDSFSKLVGLASSVDSSFPIDNNLNGLSQLGNSFNGSVEGAVKDYTRFSTNWQQQVKKDLQDWRSDVTNRLDHMFDDNVPIDGGNSKPVYVSGANGGAVHIAGVVRLDGPISVGATIEGPVTLDATQINQFSSGWESIRQSIIDFHNSFSDFTSSGDLPFNWISFYRLFYDFQNQSLTNQVALLHNLNYTNILENIYVAITNKDTNVVISAALLDDYENFVDTSKFSSIVSSLPDDLRDSLSRFGLLDSSDYSGRWWVFQAANMALQSQLALTNAALASLLSSSLQSLDDYFSDDEDPSSGLLSSWLNIIDGLPDPEELQQTISEATNIVSNVGLERVTVLYDRATNDFSSVVSSVYSDRSLPPTLSFVLIPGKNGSPDRVVNIPVSDRSSLWSFIRQGMAFGLSVVTLILFPKYLLWLLAHYTRLLEKIIKSLHAYTEH